VCLVASSARGITDEADEGAAVRLQAVVDQAATGIAAVRSDPGAGHRNYSGKDTPTLTVMVMERRVSR